MINDNYKHSEITDKIIKQAYYVHDTLGYGYLEKVYENALSKKLKDIGFNIKQQSQVKVVFEDEVVGDYSPDIIVEDKIIVEVKAVESLNLKHEVQLVNYLKATGIEIGLLINFGNKLEFKRRVFTKK